MSRNKLCRSLDLSPENKTKLEDERDYSPAIDDQDLNARFQIEEIISKESQVEVR